MANFYHLDRGNLLIKDQIIDLVKYNDISCINPERTEKIQDHYNSLFPEGVTMHGEAYFAQSNKFQYTDPRLELVFEYVRRANFPDKQSRAESFFAVNCLNDIICLAQILNVDIRNHSVWEVECTKYYKANMRLLSLGSNLITSYFANEYWSGSTGGDPQPFWEYLLVPPVRIIRKIVTI